PRPKTFVAAMLGGAMGGFFIGAMSSWGGTVIGLNTVFGPSGLLALPLMTTADGAIFTAMSIYLIGLIIAYTSGFLFTYLIGTKGVDLS
ncbi:MAG: PTS N-acetylmuramic acid transporter subunit IIBC, partial [Mycoplasmataceae bacterium]|nr:PTS N-acetylmuramic acid transporter subunit IIBC [Mycoplasmataceae bacterium]